MQKLSFKGIVVGGIVDIVATNIVTLTALVFVAAQTQLTNIPRRDQAHVIMTTLQASPGISIVLFAAGCLCSILGGYVAAKIAKRDTPMHGALSAFLCVGFGAYGLLVGHDQAKAWHHLVGFLLSPLLGALGGYLWQRKNNWTQPSQAV